MSTFLQDVAEQQGITGDEMTDGLFRRVGGVPLGTIADPDETAELALFQVSPKASYIAGPNYFIDGGNFLVVK